MKIFLPEFFSEKNLVVWILWHLVLNVILLLSLQDKLPFFKPPPTTMNHQQCRQGTPTEVVVLVLCLSTKVIHIYVYAQCVCKVMCISDVCTFFWLPGANIKLSDERRLQMELEEEKPINLRLRKKWGCRYLCTDTIWISVFYFNGFPRCQVYSTLIHPHS